MNGVSREADTSTATWHRRRLESRLCSSIRARAALACAALAWSLVGSVWGQGPPRAAQPAATLDEELLQDLLPAPPTSKDSKTKPPSEEGEDIGEESRSRGRAILDRMERVAAQLASGDTSRMTRGEQRAVLEQLDAILASRPSAPMADSGSSGADARGEAKSTGKDPQEDGKRQGDDEGAQGRPSDTPGETQPSETRLAAPREIWGELPPRLREQLRNTVPERFLPGYESLIEAYYRRLAEPRRP